MIQLADVRVFLEIVRTGGFTAAAQALRLPKSSVARQLARLEATVGCALFNRTSRVVALTDDGRTFLPYAHRLLGDGIEAENVLRSRGTGASGQLSISATALIARSFLVPFLPAFMSRNPDVRLSLWLTPARVEIGSGVGEVDIAIRLRSVAAPDMGTRKLGDIPFAIVAAPDYLVRRGVPHLPDELSGHAIVELGPPTKAHLLQLARDTEMKQVRYAPVLHMDDPEAVLLATLAGTGISALPAFLAAPSIESGRLVRIIPDWAPPPVPLNLIYRTDVAPPLRVGAYIDFLFETLGAGRLWCG